MERTAEGLEIRFAIQEGARGACGPSPDHRQPQKRAPPSSERAHVGTDDPIRLTDFSGARKDSMISPSFARRHTARPEPAGTGSSRHLDPSRRALRPRRELRLRYNAITSETTISSESEPKRAGSRPSPASISSTRLTRHESRLLDLLSAQPSTLAEHVAPPDLSGQTRRHGAHPRDRAHRRGAGRRVHDPLGSGHVSAKRKSSPTTATRSSPSNGTFDSRGSAAHSSPRKARC